MNDEKPSRRGLIKLGIAAAGGAVLVPGGVLQDDAMSAGAAGDTALTQGRSAAVVTARRFRGWVSRGTGPGRTTLQDLTLRPITGRQVVVRTEATNLCYSNVGAVLGIQPGPPITPPASATPPGTPPESPAGAPRPAAPAAGAPSATAPNAAAPAGGGGFGRLSQMALVQGHGGVGVVEAVGPDVRRVQVGDRVCVSGTPQCGACYQCLRGRADMCQFLGRQGPDDLVVMAEMRDGTPVYNNSHIGGLAELMVTFEEWVVPVFTKASAVELGMVCSCVSVAGLGATTSRMAVIEPGSIVAVVGCGPLGLSAIQGARISGASTIIAIDPIRVRRELAMKVGATHALDPNVEGDRLVERVRQLSSGPNNRLWAGGRDSGGLLGGAGADFVVEAAGADTVRPKLEAGPDPTGILPLRQAYEMTAPGGHIVTTSLPRGTLSLPAVLFTIGGRTHHAGQAGGASPMRDIPRFVALLDSGQFNAKALATTVVPLEGMREAYEQVAYRTTVTAIMTA
jgi:S-(hydroxymethyl)glutathione dehydrogenase / alcohol dehydrogenase